MIAQRAIDRSLVCGPQRLRPPKSMSDWTIRSTPVP